MMKLVKSRAQESARTARDGLTMAAGPRNGHAAPGLTFAQAFCPKPTPADLRPGKLYLATRYGERVDRHTV